MHQSFHKKDVFQVIGSTKLAQTITFLQMLCIVLYPDIILNICQY